MFLTAKMDLFSQDLRAFADLLGCESADVLPCELGATGALSEASLNFALSLFVAAPPLVDLAGGGPRASGSMHLPSHCCGLDGGFILTLVPQVSLTL